MVGGTAKRQPHRLLAPDALTQHLDQARFANARLAAEQHDLPTPLCTLRPALQKQLHLLLPPDQGRQPTRGYHVEARLRPALRQKLVHPQRFVHPFEDMLTQCLAGKEPREQSQGRGTDHDRIGSRQFLQPGGDVGRLAQGQVLLPPAATHGAYHHRTGMHAHAHGQPHAPVLLQPSVQWPQRFEYAQACPASPLSVVFVRLGIAKVHQQPIAQILRNISVKVLDHRGAGLLVRLHHVAPVFRIELPSQTGRVYQVAEQHRELAAFGLWRRLDDSREAVEEMPLCLVLSLCHGGL